MIGMPVGFGMTKRAAQFVGYVVLPVLVLVAFYIALDAYGDSRFREGRKVENAAWKQAEKELLEDAAKASTAADRVAAAAVLDHSVAVQEEKEKLDEAIANGSSPLDVLFPSSGVRP